MYFKKSFECEAHLGKSYVNAPQFRRVFRKTKKSWIEVCWNFVAKTVENANQFSLEELCRTQCSLKYFRSHIDLQALLKNLNNVLKYKTKYPISSNSHPSVIANKAIHNIKSTIVRSFWCVLPLLGFIYGFATFDLHIQRPGSAGQSVSVAISLKKKKPHQ